MKEATQSQLRKVCAMFADVASQIRAETDEVVASANHIDLIRHFDALRNANDDIKIAREALQQIADTLSSRDIPDLLRHLKETIGLKTPIVLEGVGRVTVSYRFSCSMLDKQRGMDWLKANGHGDLIQSTVNSSSLGSFARELIEGQGKELPEDIFKTGTAPYTSITKK